MATTPLLVFAIVSRGRPGQLAALLEALDRQASGVDVAAAIRVVVNQELDRPYRAALDAAAARPLPAAWRVVLEPGIPAARNALVAWLLEEGPAACVFVDDDELPAADWLAILLGLRSRHPQAVLTGPVLAAPAGPPSFLACHGAYDRVRRLSSGSRTDEAYTNNTLVPLAVLQALGPSFDARFTRAGGSDTEWFRRAARAGFEILYFQELVVRETIEPDRVPLRAVLLRWLRNGSTDTLIRRLHDRSLEGLAAIVARGLGKLGLGLLQCFGNALLLRWNAMLRGLRLATAGLGTLLGLFRLSPKQY